MQRVSLFIPCTVDLMLPKVGEDVCTLLKRLGVEFYYHEEQTCCGQPALNAGYRDHARALARHFLETFADDEIIVSPAGSCVYMVKHHYPELFEDDPVWLRLAEEMSGRIFEFSQYLVDVLGITDVGASFEGTLTYHESCHILRGLGVSEQPKQLINDIRGAEYVQLEKADQCCGFGGAFANDYPELSTPLVADKVQNFINSGADMLVLLEPGCLLNIAGYLHRNHPEKQAIHMASLLAAA